MYKDKNHTANAPYVNVSTSDDKAVLDPFMNLDILEEQPKNESVKKWEKNSKEKKEWNSQLKFSKTTKIHVYLCIGIQRNVGVGSVMTYSQR